MRNFHLLKGLALACFLIICAACGSDGGGGNVSVQLNLTQEADPSLFSPDDRIVVRIYGPDFEERRYEFSRSRGSGRIDGVPEGVDRVIKVDEFDIMGVLIARGLAYGVRVKDGEESSIPVEMVPKGWVITLAGGNVEGGDSPDGTYAGDALLNGPAEVEIYKGDLVINDLSNRSLKTLDKFYKIHRVANIQDLSILNKGDKLFEIDLPYPLDFISDDYLYCLAADMQIYSTDLFEINDILFVDNPGIIFPNDVDRTLAGKNGEFFLADYSDHIIYRIIDGTRQVFAERGNNPITIGEGIDKNNYGLLNPSGIYYDGSRLYFSDSGNNKIKYIENGLVYTYVGSFIENKFFEGIRSLDYNVKNPSFIKVYKGSLFVYESDTGNILTNRNNEIYSVIINGSTPSSILVPLPPDTAGLVNPRDVAADEDGNLYIADTGNNAIRMVVGGAL